MGSSQTLRLEDRRILACWAADCAEHVLGFFVSEAPDDRRPVQAIEHARAFGRGELGASGEIRRRFVAGRAAHPVRGPAAAAAARSAAQAAAVAHMGAHALGAAAYAAKAAAAAATPDRASALDDEVAWQLSRLTDEQRVALLRLPLLGEDRAGPLGPGLLSSGALGAAIASIQTDLRQKERTPPPPPR